MAKTAITIDGIPRAVERDLPEARTRFRLAIGRAVTATVDRAHGEMQRMISLQGPSPPGSPPGKQTGEYRASWDKQVHPSGLGGSIFTPDRIAHFLEYGTVRMAARPHVGPLGEKMKNPYVSKLKEEVKKEF